MNHKISIGLIALFVLFFLLFNAPFLQVPKGLTNGLPTIMIYIGSIWIILILLMRMISSKEEKNNH